jgi:replication initiation protein RepC
MDPYQPTTPFGRRPVTVAHLATQAIAKSRPLEKVVHKWQVFRAVCTARSRINVSERALSVLNALLTFHPETALTGEGLIVFPSNDQLSLRAHGMTPTTLRRQLRALVDAGLIVRRDSPNGKRYARKGRGGEIEMAFGFDLSPLVVRAEEFEACAEEVRADERALRLVRERITLCRRDIAKMIATAVDEGVPTRREGQGPEDWTGVRRRYQAVVGRIPRRADREILELIAEELSQLADEVVTLLENHINVRNLTANESQNGRHIQNSNPNPPIELEPRIQECGATPARATPQTRRSFEGTYPLGMVLDACPDIADYSKGGSIGNWRDFLAAVAVVRPMLGVSPSAWEDAQSTMGEIPAAVVLAAILQRGSAIKSAGGYLRGLTRKAEAGEFSLGPMLMALIGTRHRERRRA